MGWNDGNAFWHRFNDRSSRGGWQIRIITSIGQVLVLCHAAIDATIRDTETGDCASNSKKLFGGDGYLEWLRKKRNRLVHVSEWIDITSRQEMLSSIHLGCCTQKAGSNQSGSRCR
jgi:hypothetical protein